MWAEVCVYAYEKSQKGTLISVYRRSNQRLGRSTQGEDVSPIERAKILGSR